MIDVNKFPITANLLEGADEGHVSRLSDRAIAALVHGHNRWARVYSMRARRIVINARELEVRKRDQIGAMSFPNLVRFLLHTQLR